MRSHLLTFLFYYFIHLAPPLNIIKIYFIFSIYLLQATFSSVSPSFDYLLSQQQSTFPQHYQQQQQQTHQDSYSDFLLSPNQPHRATYLEAQARHSNSSSDTLVGIEEEASNILQPPITRFKEEAPFLCESHTPTPATSASEHEQDCLFESSSSEELGLLSLRSSSDPVLSANSRQAALQNVQRPQTSVDLSGINPILPSFQETYQIKYSQLANFGLKMDEDCFNAAAQHQSIAAYHHHPHPHQALHPGHGYGFQQHPESQYIQSGSFYTQPYEGHSLVSYYIKEDLLIQRNQTI